MKTFVGKEEERGKEEAEEKGKKEPVFTVTENILNLIVISLGEVIEKKGIEEEWLSFFSDEVSDEGGYYPIRGE